MLSREKCLNRFVSFFFLQLTIWIRVEKVEWKNEKGVALSETIQRSVNFT